MEVEQGPGRATDFENVEIGEIARKVKVPRRTIYFASGETMEEYSTDEEEEEEEEPKKACDFIGEKLASLFGITTPKYQYAIDEYYRIKKEEEEEEEENHLSEEAERRFAEQHRSDHNDHLASQSATVVQPDASGASFVKISLELEHEPSLSVSDTNRLPSPLPS